MQVGVIFSLIFSIVITVFAIQNAQPVSIKFFLFNGQASLALVILISTTVGALIIGLLNLYSRVKTKITIKELNNRIATIKADNDRLLGELENFKPKVQPLFVKDEEEVRSNEDDSLK